MGVVGGLGSMVGHAGAEVTAGNERAHVQASHAEASTRWAEAQADMATALGVLGF